MKNKFIRNYLNFSVRERNGILVLCVLLLSIFIVKIIISNQKNNSEYDFRQYENEIDSFLNKQMCAKNNPAPFYFDPNSASKEDLLMLGLSAKVVSNICNYREKGGKFYKPEDLKKIFNVTDEMYERIKDFIIIENPVNNKKHAGNESKKSYPEKELKELKELAEFDPNNASYEELQNTGLKKQQINNILKYREKGGVFSKPEDLKKIYGVDSITFSTLESYIHISDDYKNKENIISNEKDSLIIELNSASEVELQRLKGIGPTFSKRIIEYRDKLGGFVSNEQLLEVYGFTNEMLNIINPHLIIDENKIKKININTAEYKELISHPYIDKKNTILILNYRNFAKEIKSFEELLKQKAITEKFYKKLYPYITTL